DRDEHSRFLPWLIAFMVFLSILAVAGMLVLNATASRWDAGVRGTLTVQVVPTADALADETRLNQVLTVLATAPEVARYDALDDSRLMRLLEPWLGGGVEKGDLPLPRLVDVELKQATDLTAADLGARLSEKVQGVTIDDHRVWLDRLVRMIETFEALALVLLLFIVLATVGTVVFTTRTGLAIHREAIEVLHLIGAQDAYIARQFARRALGLGIKGGLLGLFLALPTLWMLAHLAASLDDKLIPDIGFGPWHWGLLLALPVSVAMVAMTTAKVTVLRNLSRML
ncbi:MAG: FtsX-like permease family protein, partial [Rhodospirillaceae bacterium]